METVSKAFWASRVARQNGALSFFVASVIITEAPNGDCPLENPNCRYDSDYHISMISAMIVYKHY